MIDKDKVILQESAMVLADQIVSNIPLLGIAWGLSKALYGAGIQLRQNRALEWVEMVRDNPSILTERILSDENFQDGFVYMLEHYIKERNEEKREIARSIFLGFANDQNKQTFQLEKFSHTLSQLNSEDIEVIRDVNYHEQRQVDSKIFDKSYQIYGDTDEHIDSVHNLINLGILYDHTANRFGPITGPFVSISPFGKGFVNYIE